MLKTKQSIRCFGRPKIQTKVENIRHVKYIRQPYFHFISNFFREDTKNKFRFDVQSLPINEVPMFKVYKTIQERNTAAGWPPDS